MRILSLLLSLLLSQNPGPSQSGALAGSGGCVDGPTTNLITRFDSLSLAPCSGGGVTTWVSGFGTNTATAEGGTNPPCDASIFGTAPGVYLNAGWFLLSNPITTSQSQNMTVMAVWKPLSVSQKNSVTGNGSSNSAFNYILPNTSGVQELDSGQAVLLGTGTATATNGDIYQTNVSYVYPSHPTFRFNKAADATVSGSDTTFSNSLNAIAQDNGGENPNIYLGALYFFSPALTTGDIETWETTLSCKYPGA